MRGRRRLRRWRDAAWAKKDCEWRLARRRMLEMDGVLVAGSKRSVWMVVNMSAS